MTFAEVQAESLLGHTCANGRDLAKRAVFPTHTDNDRNTLQMTPLKQQYKNYIYGIDDSICSHAKRLRKRALELRENRQQ